MKADTGKEGDMSRLRWFSILIVVLSAFCTRAIALDFYFKDQQYSFQALRALGAAAGGGADAGEVLITLGRIREGDDESWYAAWRKTAEAREQAGDGFLARGRKVSARQEYLRASNYYRTAEFFLRGNPADPRIVATWRKGREMFLKFARLADQPIRPVEIPFEGTTLPGYLALVDNSGKKRPLLIIQTGFDGTAEELYYSNAVFALRRGYNVLLFEGPGQGRVIREQKIPFRPNWETVVTPVVDFALKRREVERDNIALMGISFGGYLVPRAAAFEHRLKACIANGGVYDMHRVVMKRPGMEQALDDPQASAEIDSEIYKMMETDPALRWAFGNGMFTFDAKSPTDWMRKTRPYTMKDVAGNIRCDMLVVDSEDDKDMPGQARQLYDTLKGPREFMLFTREEGAGEHCQIGAALLSNARILDWLDGKMKARAKPRRSR